MARAATVTGPVERAFLNNPGKTLSIARLKRETGIGNGQAISGAISYLNSKVRNGKGGIAIETITRGQSWAYYPDRQPTVKVDKTLSGTPVTTITEAGAKARRQRVIAGGKVNHTLKIGEPGEGDRAAAERLRAVAEKITAPAPGWHKVPAGEPAVSFKVIGTLMETGDLVLQGASEGVQGVWMARRVD